MKQLNKLTLLLFIVATVLLTAGCASLKKSGCGCGGFVGYGNKK
jgi:outer membrane murein-binding lipoprotein Lpp